ncbi:MAG: short-chain dehydrogenase [Lacrimispora sp.]|uniref:short-chain dehydrogenase n=1 Tax=Lacrimispora sp. TaxID=2719234 RepID=UPI0039E21868
MAKQETGNRPGIGSPSLILIFIVMCLVTFGMLSLSTAKSEWNLAERNAASVTEYYRADREGEEFYRLVAEAAQEARQESADLKEAGRILEEKLGEYYVPERGSAMTQIAMERAQALLVEVVPFPEEGQAPAISQWKVIQTEDFEIYDSMPVWTGGEGEEEKE